MTDSDNRDEWIGVIYGTDLWDAVRKKSHEMYGTPYPFPPRKAHRFTKARAWIIDRLSSALWWVRDRLLSMDFWLDGKR